MSFTEGKPQVATKSDVEGRWSGGKPGEYFRCAFCGYKFVIGDYWRWQYTNSTLGAWGNPLVCFQCDDFSEVLIKRWKARHDLFNKLKDTKFWWFFKGL